MILCPTVASKVFIFFFAVSEHILYSQGPNKLHKNDSIEIKLNLVNCKGESQDYTLI
jgi:hypothetical protein